MRASTTLQGLGAGAAVPCSLCLTLCMGLPRTLHRVSWSDIHFVAGAFSKEEQELALPFAVSGMSAGWGKGWGRGREISPRAQNYAMSLP